MDIRSINKGSQEVYSVKNKENLNKKYNKSSEDVASKKTSSDKLTLSEEAKKLQPIKQKISEGFYDKPEVLDSVAQKLDKIYSPDKV